MKNSKRYLIKASILFLLSVTAPSRVTAEVQSVVITLHFAGVDDENYGGGVPKVPVLPLIVYLNDHSLAFTDAYSEAVPVELTDATGNVVYSDYLPAGTQTLSLPATLSGTYTLYIYMGNYIFAGQIIL